MKKIISFAVAAVFFASTTAQIKIDRTKKPAAGAAPVISIKDPVTFVMPNGMTVLVVENHKLPKVSASLNIDAGPIIEGKKAGVMQLMGQMLEEGTQSKPKANFDEAVDLLGANLGMSSNGGFVSSLTRHFDKAFSLFTDALKNPAFPQESFDKLKTQTITGIKTTEKSASAISARVVSALSYGKQSAQGEFITEESIKALVLNDVKEAYKKYITPSRSYLTFVGDITPAAAKALVLKALGTWSGTKLPVPAAPLAENVTSTEINFVDVPTAVQGEISVSNLISNTLNNPDYHALLLANQILGGGAESKLFMNLRETHGFTYGSYSRVGNGRFQAQFRASAAVRSDKADSAVAEIINEIKNMRDGKMTEEELNSAKAKYNGSFALGMEDPANTATYASNILINGLQKDYYKTFLQKINRVTMADVQRVAQKYFSDKNARIVMVGNAAKILPNITRFGYPVKMYDKYANPVADKPKTDVNETAKTSDGVSAYSVIENYLKAIGGKEEVKKINSVKTTFSTDIMGRSMDGTEMKMNPSLRYSNIKMGAMTVFESSFDGTKGYMGQMGQKKDLTPEEAKDFLDEKGVIPQLYYNGADYKTEYIGTGKVGDQDAYKLKVIKPSGKLSVEYYSVKTDLLLKEEATEKQNGQDVSTSVEYSDYRKIGNVLFAFGVNRNIGEMNIDMKVKEMKVNEGVSATDFK
jgi:zinc protease